MTDRLAQFDKEVADVTQRRGKIYGHPKKDFDRIVRLQSVVDECAHPLMWHVLRMICVKMARLIETPDHLDSLIDIAGYSRTGVMTTEPE